MNLEDGQTPSPIIAIYQTLWAMHPKWHVEIGQPRGPRLDSRDRVADGQGGPIPCATHTHWRAAAHRRSSHHRRLLCLAVWLVVWRSHGPVFALSLCAGDYARQCFL